MKCVSFEFMFLTVLAALGLASAAEGDEAESAFKAKAAAPAAKLASRQHWAFNQPEHPAIPEVQKQRWVRNPLDAFILGRLEKENLAPSLEADRRTLIRRLSFDLLGLPPRLEDVEAFVADQRPDAYELLVERLLASPHFGERWGRQWLDLARYADSDGYEKDSVRAYAYLYRDWVIDAINRDIPFDQFSIEQLAGDLLPSATEEQKIATGFHRNTLTNKEGGVDQEEFRCKATVDRVSTTGTVWLGLTVGCAECHNHKYDPISQLEFYQLYAFFNNASEKDLPAPRPAELAQYKKEKEQWDAERDRIKAELADYLQHNLRSHQTAWEQSMKLPAERWSVLALSKVSSTGGSTLKIQDDSSIEVTGKNPATDSYVVEAATELKNITGFRLEVLDDPVPGKGPGRSKNGNFVLNEFIVQLEVLGAARSEGSERADRAGSQVGKTLSPQPEPHANSPHPDALPKERGKYAAPDSSFGRSGSLPTQESALALPNPDSSRRRSEGRGERIEATKSKEASAIEENRSPIPITLQRASADHAPKDWPVEGAIDGDPKTGWAIDPQLDQRHVAVFETKDDLTVPPGGKLVFQLNQNYGSQHTIGRFRLSATSSPRPLKADLMPDADVKILERPPEQRNETEKAILAKYYREEIDLMARAFDHQLAEHAKREPKYPETKAQTIAENEKPRQTHVHVRGDFLRKGEEVEPGTLAVLHAFKPRPRVVQASLRAVVSELEASQPSVAQNNESNNLPPGKEEAGKMPALRCNADRLDLAEWLFDPANPLTARVTVNRVWSHFFGRGLVSTLNDFGTRGEVPSHPELLDWLATEFQRLGWNRKKLIKLIVTSAAYRQSSQARPELMDRDPNNILLARQSRFRLDAECVRDAFLTASGLISLAIGGPSIRPPLPADIAALGYANSIKWKESEGSDRYRRGLYIHFQRTVPYPMLMTFDAPDSNATCTRRERSNTPLQALTTLNDPVFFECAQTLGRRLAAEPETGVQEKLRRAFELCLSRPPTNEELGRLKKLYEDYVQLIRRNPENAAKIVGDGGVDSTQAVESAALVGVARTILNLDEFVTRE